MNWQGYLSAALLICCCVLCASINADCSQVETGSITVDEGKQSVLQITHVRELSCICTPVGDSSYSYMGNEAVLINYDDCGAMRFFGRVIFRRRRSLLSLLCANVFLSLVNLMERTLQSAGY
jgi:hypothetical protein